ncbi:unnamed protein product [Rotaria socialis]|uniref:Uncharacterized protein n=1 Tax=Rotaria socialis TaxID=392032 RepID=A0A818KLV5_9BILA|nr:unnamed protein product [Rotaria socialis]CAF3436339.1 unnamed protein product [Rotaria socialis]CAF3450024.1 unnamed protein product [Rotaria socialis]CAF3489748.1 unnamed protein product [Rotaria socialis]CAF3557362.1 unnamed protein product [Rotaria socialis]
MSSTSRSKLDFVPIESIAAFVFIGVMILVGLIARCLAVNHSTVRSAQSIDLVIYKPAPKPVPAPKVRRSSLAEKFPSNNDSRDQLRLSDDSITPTRIQRGPKNL